MDAFSPELAQHWRASEGAAGDAWLIGRGGDADLSPAQQVALEELAERVTAARSVY